MESGDKLLGGIEAGGTKMVCAVGHADGRLEDKTRLPTGNPDETLAEMCAYFEESGIAALGIATFGPAVVNPRSPLYGRLLGTPKPGWAGLDFAGALRESLHVPVAFDTDVNAACLGELRFGGCRGLDAAAYVTVGTGIGAGVCLGGRPLHGMLHPEAGHVLVRRDPRDGFAGICPAHGDCLEGLASGPAICARFDVDQASDLAGNERFLELESGYLAQGLMALALVCSPRRIAVGGGVVEHVPALLPLVREKLAALLNGYLSTPELAHMESYIVEPACGGDQGVLGAIALADDVLRCSRE